MSTIPVKIDRSSYDLLSDYVNEYQSKLNQGKISKREVLDKMISYCFYQSIDVLGKNKTYGLQRILSNTETNLIKEIKEIQKSIKEIPKSIKGIIDPDEVSYNGMREHYFMIESLRNYLQKKDIYEDFLNSLNEKQREFFIEIEIILFK